MRMHYTSMTFPLRTTILFVTFSVSILCYEAFIAKQLDARTGMELRQSVTPGFDRQYKYTKSGRL